MFQLLTNYCRSQANDIPHLLVAPKIQIGPQLPDELQAKGCEDAPTQDEPEADRSIYTNGTGDSRGWYEDGAYIAMPDEDEGLGSHGDQGDCVHERELQEAYFSSIVERYTAMRQKLHRTVPPGSSKQLQSSQATTAAAFGRNSSTVKQWSGLLRNTDPHPLQVALMSKDTVLRILRVMLGGKFLRRGQPLSERTSHWLWALLARLPDEGELNYSEIGWIRDLGRRAVLLGRSIAEMAALKEECAENGLGVNDGVDDGDSEAEAVAGDEEGNGEPDTIRDDETQADGEAEMELQSDSDEGEIKEDDQQLIAEAKRKLLDSLDCALEESQKKEQEEMNTLATLSMILTVAGEFYGQKDLLEFRDPFASL